jgi:hypothetical protein
MEYLDRHPDVISWSSEEMVIPYLSPVDNQVHRYFPDMVVQRRNRDGSIKTIVVEIKPEAQTRPPKPSKKKAPSPRMIQEQVTYMVNQAKWESAQKFCDAKGWEFRVLTEKHLGIK